MKITITEVGLRDGIQSEPRFIPTNDKIRLIESVLDAGARSVEATAFVSPHAVPQMADAEEVIKGLTRRRGVEICALAPNARGLHRAIRAGVDTVMAFVSVSESHNRKNLSRSIAQSLDDVARMADMARDSRIALKGALATAFGCPFEGNMEPGRVVALARRYAQLGITRLTLGDTTGMATPGIVRRVCGELRSALPELRITLHFHNTRGMAMVNVAEGLALGIDEYESSIGGTGGCPFAPGATGNISTEDLVHFLHEEGHETGIDLEAVTGAALALEQVLGRPLPGQVMRAGPRNRRFGLDSVRSATARDVAPLA